MAELKTDLDYEVEAAQKKSIFTANRFLYASATGLTCLIFYLLLAFTFSPRSLFEEDSESLTTHIGEPGGCSKIQFRREWRNLRKDEQLEYIDAIKCLQTTPGLYRDDQSLYGDYANLHSHAGKIGHDTTLFLPWHRYLLHNFENDLRTHCGFKGTIPYWNWVLDWEALDQAPVWDNVYGIGGNGTGEESVGHGRCVETGPFSHYQALRFGANETHHCLSRGFLTGEKSDRYSAELQPEKLDDIMQKDDYYDFWNTLEFAAHEAIPRWIQGEFFEFTSPNDPIFYFHHCQVDRLWAEWQLADPEHRAETIFGTMVDDELELDKLGPKTRIRDILHTDSGPLCYRYLK
ncbi:Di-copper centre-containing protein [Pseudovirgaria hyperparasitica]|uniref:Di-copper centre-containing protein n=1 Tax=Pseudovirgaria hyperparasitica TaxID=470096 RepID=A0A6A6VU64_9PEZI|nr:Di-copper centre-containing protein [Pseudovirgaria hyperparasitica]KAF2753753.1 Di-copper centre-containing protein [Pseudovirgaria hyperparasitica]